MASKMQESDTKNRLVSMFKKSTTKSEDQHSEGEAIKQEVSKLFVIFCILFHILVA